MAQRGRKPIPTAINVLEGNPGKRELNINEPKPVSIINENAKTMINLTAN